MKNSIASAVLIATALTACGGGGGEAQDENASGAIVSSNSNTNSSSTGDGYYSITATPNQSSIPNLICAGGEGQLALYNGKLIGWAAGYGINVDVSDTGNIDSYYNVGGAAAGTFRGTINSQSGNGQWADDSSPCSGSWSATKIVFPAASGQSYTLSAGSFPPSLKIRFLPNNDTSQSCTSMSGYVNTNGRVSTGSSGVTYNGYALATQGYRVDVRLRLNPDSGSVDGSLAYDPLGVQGTFIGDMYFADTARTYSQTSTGANSVCTGVWHVATVNSDFPAVGVDNNTNTSSQTEPGTSGSGNTDRSTSIPYCQEASDRILASVNPGMTPAQVLAAVGKPLRIDGSYGTDWYYGRYSYPSVEFGYANQTSTTVEGYDANDQYCSNIYAQDNSLIANANSLIANPTRTDYTNEVPTCQDAATRILAWVSPGMTPAQVRKLVGKPVEIDGSYGTDWDYGNYGVQVEFGYVNQTISTVEGYSVQNYSICQ